jgi:hypothetical protein
MSMQMSVFQITLGVIVKLKHKEKKEKISKIRNTKASLKMLVLKKIQSKYLIVDLLIKQ